jgi:hypothetical protein
VNQLKRQRQAISALAWFGVIFFAGWITVGVVQAVNHGYGLIHGRVLENEVGDQRGHGWLVDLLLLAGAGAACGLLVGAWRWVVSRLRIGSESIATPAEVEEQPFYLIDIPRITRVLVGVGIACTIGVAVCGALLFPIILLKYGW